MGQSIPNLENMKLTGQSLFLFAAVVAVVQPFSTQREPQERSGLAGSFLDAYYNTANSALGIIPGATQLLAAERRLVEGLLGCTGDEYKTLPDGQVVTVRKNRNCGGSSSSQDDSPRRASASTPSSTTVTTSTTDDTLTRLRQTAFRSRSSTTTPATTTTATTTTTTTTTSVQESSSTTEGCVEQYIDESTEVCDDECGTGMNLVCTPVIRQVCEQFKIKCEPVVCEKVLRNVCNEGKCTSELALHCPEEDCETEEVCEDVTEEKCELQLGQQCQPSCKTVTHKVPLNNCMTY